MKNYEAAQRFTAPAPGPMTKRKVDIMGYLFSYIGKERGQATPLS